jgi:hypothetical protein
MAFQFNSGNARRLHQMRPHNDRQELQRRITAVKIRLKCNPALLADRPHPMVLGKTLRDRVLSILAYSDDNDALGRACAVVEKA